MSSRTNTNATDINSNDDDDAKHTSPAASADKSQMPVDHTYINYVETDHSQLSHPLSSRSTLKSFPTKLHVILSNSAYADIIAWSPRSRSFRVLDKK